MLQFLALMIRTTRTHSSGRPLCRAMHTHLWVCIPLILFTKLFQRCTPAVLKEMND